MLNYLEFFVMGKKKSEVFWHQPRGKFFSEKILGKYVPT